MAAYQEQIRSYLQQEYLLSVDKVEEMLPGFFDSLRTNLTGLEEAQASGDLQALSRAGHTLKGALLNLGLDEPARIALTIEQKGKSGEQADFAALVEALREQLLLIVNG